MNLGDIIQPRILTPRDKAQADLFVKFAKICAADQASTEMIAGAAINLVLTVVHRMSFTQGEAEARWDDLWGQGKEILRAKFRKRDQDKEILRPKFRKRDAA